MSTLDTKSSQLRVKEKSPLDKSQNKNNNNQKKLKQIPYLGEFI